MKRSAPSRRPRTRAVLLIGLLPCVLGILLAHWPPTAAWERAGLDLLFKMRGLRPAPAGVCVVAIDDDSYAELGLDAAQPWPRALHAELIRTLAREGARAVAFDVLFDVPRDPEQDAALESALRETGMVVLGATIEETADPRFRQTRRVEPWAPFARAAAAVAEADLPTDSDGVIRSTWLMHRDRPSLALAAYEVATGDRSQRDPSARLLDYYGPGRTVRTVSLYQALDPTGHLPPGFLRDKIVFVGLSQPTVAGSAPKDAFETPYYGGAAGPTYGVEIHATVAGNLLEVRRIRLLDPWAEAALLLLVPLLAALVFLTLRPVAGALALLALEVGPWAVGLLAFTQAGLWIPVIIPAAVQLPAAFVLSVVWYYLTTVRERERIKRAFSFYLSPEMIERFASDTASLNLGGEEVVGTALFTDIKGFTSIAEPLSAPQAASLLNAYFSDVTRHIFREQGTLIKFIGDAVFAIWGAPMRVNDHAARACRAALALAGAQDGSGPAASLVTRIGVHTGPMLVGNLGSAQRFDYTAIGDAVNLASRLEGLNKPFATRALVSGTALAETGGEFVVRPLGRVRVAGKQEPVEVYELLGLQGEPVRSDGPPLDRFAQALEAFQSKRFDEAAAGFREVLQACGGRDGPSEFFLRTLQGFTLDPPASDWDGVVVFESK